MFYILILILFAIDQISKYYIRAYFAVGESVPVLDGIFHITYVQNTGAAFGIFAEQTQILTYVTFALLGAIFGYSLYFKNKVKNKEYNLNKNVVMLYMLALALTISGGLGNAIDRLLRGYVTDMFDFRVWPVFNIADIYVCVGCVLFFFCILKFDSKKDK